MVNRRGAWLVVLAVALLGALAVVRIALRPPPPAPGRGPRGAAARAAWPGRAWEPERSPTSPEPAAAGGVPDDEIADPAPAELPVPRRRNLLVLSDAGQPLAGATVLFLDLDSVAGSRRLSISARHDPLFDSLAMAFRTGRGGEVALPPFRSAMVRGEWEDRAGERRIASDDEGRLRLVLYSSRILGLQAVDTLGFPLPGVPVGLFEHGPWKREPSPPLWRGVTRKPDGIAEIPRVLSLLDLPPRGGAGKRGRYVFASFAVPMTGAPEWAIDPLDLPVGPVRMTLPPSGTLVVRLLGGNDKPYQKAVLVRLRSKGSSHFIEERYAEQGELRIPFLSLGTELEGEAVPDDPQVRSVAFQAAGPSEPGEVRVTEVRIASRNPVVEAVLLDPARRAIRGRKAALREAWWLGHQGSGIRLLARSDPQGGIRWVLPLPRGNPAPHGAFEIWLPPPRSSRADTPGLLADVRIGPLAPDTRQDLGAVVLREIPLLVAGRVVDSDGHPVASAEASVPDARGVPPVRSESDGSFRIHSDTVPDAPELIVRPPSAGSRLDAARKRFLPGALDVRVVLAWRTEIRGSVLVGPGVPYERIAVRLSTDRGEAAVLDPRGRFRFEDAAARPSFLDFVLDAERRPFLQLGPIAVEPGRVNDVGEIDLRPLVVGRVVQIVDEGRHPIPKAEIWDRGDPLLEKERNWRPSLLARTGHFGRCRLATSIGRIDVRVTASGYRPRNITVDLPDITVVLRPAGRARFVLAADADPPPPPYRLEAKVRALDPSSGGFRKLAEGAPGGRPFEDFIFGMPGLYEVRWRILDTSARTGAGKAREVGGGAPRRLEIREDEGAGGGAREFEVPLAAEDLEKAGASGRR